MSKQMEAIQQIRHELAEASKHFAANNLEEAELALAKVMFFSARLRVYISAYMTVIDEERASDIYTSDRAVRLGSFINAEESYIYKFARQILSADLYIVDLSTASWPDTNE